MLLPNSPTSIHFSSFIQQLTFCSFLYQIESLAEEDDGEDEILAGTPGADAKVEPVYFKPKPLRRLAAVDELESLSPMTESKVLNLTGEDSPQIYSICGRGAMSSFKVLKHGLQVTEMATSELPGTPTSIWTLRNHADGKCSYTEEQTF